MYRGFWKGTPVAIKKWFDPNHSDAMVQEFRWEGWVGSTGRAGRGWGWGWGCNFRVYDMWAIVWKLARGWAGIP